MVSSDPHESGLERGILINEYYSQNEVNKDLYRHEKKSSIVYVQCIEAKTMCFYPVNALIYEPRLEISNNVVCATNKASDHPTHTRSLIGAFTSRLNFKGVLSY